ncbi:fungal hydrophobin [Pholiota conissans]|uniref:Hydrophobin n=1 Tax=Pholiota conissans TaxID=109636 RepID=A0A9P5Z5E4_9AGAR|nr:fungal hydrophobin [Pholiota conissans]
MNFKALVISALPVLAAATAIVPRQTGDCNTGSIQCCMSTQTASLTSLAQLGGLLGLSLPPITGLIGLACSGINVLGVGGTSCSAQPVCCTNNSFNGLVALGCSPINLNL